MNRFNLLCETGLVSEKQSDFQRSSVMAVLKDFSNEQIYKAYIDHIGKSSFPFKPCDVVSFWKEKAGADKTGMEKRADAFLDALDKGFSVGVDCLCADAAAVEAFKATFGSLSNYGSRPTYMAEKDRAKFREAYVASGRSRAGSMDGYLLAGIYHRQGGGRYRMIGKVPEWVIEEYERLYPTMKRQEPYEPRAALEYRHEEIQRDPKKLNEILDALIELTRCK